MFQDFVVFCFFSYLIIQLVRLVLADADLTLLWKEKFGKKPDVLKGKIVWITGASSGIGEYLAYELAKAGCRLVLSARREEELNRVKQQCLTFATIKEDDIMVLCMDLLHTDRYKSTVERVLKAFKQIDILVNNSGRTQRGLAVDTDLAVDREIMDLNYFAAISLTKAVIPHMVKRKSGHVVVTSSIAGKVGLPISASYTATKFAVQGWFNMLRLEVLSENIAVTLVCPGPIRTDSAKNSYGQSLGKPGMKEEFEKTVKRMSTERCAELMAIGIANKLDEIWISNHPILAVAYCFQYLPDLAMLISKKFGMREMMNLRDTTGSNNVS